MGAAGCGKTAVATEVCRRLGWQLIEGDDLHPASNIDKMAHGEPLSDDDRWPWLQATGGALRGCGPSPAVVTCSALKAAYREVLDDCGDVRFVHLFASESTLLARTAARVGHFMKPSMITSQLADLEPLGPNESGAAVDANQALVDVVADVLLLALRWWLPADARLDSEIRRRHVGQTHHAADRCAVSAARPRI
jgi:gluconokinase